MRLNFLMFNAKPTDGYGRYSARMIAALRKAGVTVTPHLKGCGSAVEWMQREWGLRWDCPTISCMPPYELTPLPKGAGPHWLLTMTEGSELPEGWKEYIDKCGIERVIVPCEHNAKVFREGGVQCPVSVIAGGTDPAEFPMITGPRPERPYTFLTLADRGYRKGYDRVYSAFYHAFGGKTTGEMDVRLMIKCVKGGNEQVDELLTHAGGDWDRRMTWLVEDIPDIRDLYRQVDCLVLPSRSEGWGMPHREAAMMGLPVITQAHSGLDDGHTREWAIVLEQGRMQQIDDMGKHIAGEWMVADVDELAAAMRQVKAEPWTAHKHAKLAREWLRGNQTWQHSAVKLLTLMEDEGLYPEEATLEMEAMTWPT